MENANAIYGRSLLIYDALFEFFLFLFDIGSVAVYSDFDGK